MGITQRQFEQLKERVAGRRPAPAGSSSRGAVRAHAVILGVDPSLRGTGYGVVRLAQAQPEPVAYGTIRCPAAWERSRCLVRIASGLRDIVRAHQPTVCVVEGLFYAQNLRTALVLGEARGAVLVAVAEAGLDIYEIAPRKVKQAIVGYGAAGKTAVARMVQRILGLPKEPPPDAADALALALTHAQEQKRHWLTPPKKL